MKTNKNFVLVTHVKIDFYVSKNRRFSKCNTHVETSITWFRNKSPITSVKLQPLVPRIPPDQNILPHSTVTYLLRRLPPDKYTLLHPDVPFL